MPADPTETSAQAAGGTEPSSYASSRGGNSASTPRSFHLFCRLCRTVTMNDPVVTPCGHAFCHKCIGKELMERTDCPVCQKSILLRLAME
ncbi:hypothetical protein C8T65DRAFT_650763 [Cerioporus squamosus]|nr:hypothetical protein C8T65DRAFT_650763 [Cerioporus squamosus]